MSRITPPATTEEDRSELDLIPDATEVMFGCRTIRDTMPWIDQLRAGRNQRGNQNDRELAVSFMVRRHDQSSS